MKTSHTPGPWWVMESGVRDVGCYICHTNAPPHFQGQDERYANEIEERKKNKILIAAAPDLLYSLKEAAAVLEAFKFQSQTAAQVLSEAYAVIAKATGEANEKVEVPTAAQ